MTPTHLRLLRILKDKGHKGVVVLDGLTPRAQRSLDEAVERGWVRLARELCGPLGLPTGRTRAHSTPTGLDTLAAYEMDAVATNDELLAELQSYWPDAFILRHNAPRSSGAPWCVICPAGPWPEPAPAARSALLNAIRLFRRRSANTTHQTAGTP